ncbi:hypothetical protein HJFPF1_00146 [Paramyrothecium foliicola]|nr:hypothetical protein HJFPF1_00146 [Paramyrothecium foliicola]
MARTFLCLVVSSESVRFRLTGARLPSDLSSETNIAVAEEEARVRNLKSLLTTVGKDAVVAQKAAKAARGNYMEAKRAAAAARRRR